MAVTRYSAVFVSPHLDDAVFSCGAEIARMRRLGRVLVLNVFTRYLDDVKRRAVVLGPQRYAEEEAAAKFLGFTSERLDELDVSFRRASYASLGNIFRPPVEDDLGEYLWHLRQQLFDRLSEVEFDRLYVPLGIGWHVDHVLTHLVFDSWAMPTKLVYYEDAPYCLIPHATRARIEEIAAYAPSGSDETLAPAGTVSASWQATRAYASTALMRNLQPVWVRWGAVPVVGVYLYRLLALHRQDGSAPAGKRALQAWVEPVPAVDARRKVEAMMLYESQFKEFFSSPADCSRQFREYATRMRAACETVERFWIGPDGFRSRTHDPSVSNIFTEASEG